MVSNRSRFVDGMIWTAGLCLLFAWAGLAFFNFPHTDDFYALKDAGSRSLPDYLAHIRNTWSGRWWPALLAWLFVNPGRLYDAYWLHTLLFIIFITACCWVWLRQLMPPAKALIWAVSATLTAIVLCPEPGTQLYWFSSAATYGSSVGLWMLLLAGIIALQKNPAASWPKLVTGLSILCLCGSHEPALCWLGAFLIYIAWNGRHQIPKSSLIAGILIYVAGAWLLVSAPGNAVRGGMGSAPGISAGIAGAFAHGLALFYKMATEPAFWLIVGWMGWRYGWSWGKQALLLATLLVLSMMPVLYFSGGSLPMRVYNFYAVTWIATVITLPFLHPLISKAKNPLLPFSVALLMLALFASPKTEGLVKSYVAAPMHKAVMEQRQRLLESGQPAATITSYPGMQEQLLKTRFAGSRQVFKDWMMAGPPYLHLFDDLATPESRAVVDSFYRMRSR